MAYGDDASVVTRTRWYAKHNAESRADTTQEMPNSIVVNATCGRGWANPRNEHDCRTNRAQFCRPIHSSRDTNREPVYPRGYGLLHRVGGGQAPKGQYGRLNEQI